MTPSCGLSRMEKCGSLADHTGSDAAIMWAVYSQAPSIEPAKAQPVGVRRADLKLNTSCALTGADGAPCLLHNTIESAYIRQLYLRR